MLYTCNIDRGFRNMKLRINLSNYSLAYLMGDRVFQDSFLLSREIIKKAYQEKLYYISNKKNIEELIQHQNSRKELLVYAGIPTFSEVCTESSPSKVLYAAKISLNYEDLAELKQKGEFLEHPSIELESVEKTTLYLTIENGNLVYKEGEEIPLDLTEPCEEVQKHFLNELQTFHYEFVKELEFMKRRITDFLKSEESRSRLRDEDTVQEMKEIYEMFIFLHL